jgi:hypothetical protein
MKLKKYRNFTIGLLVGCMLMFTITSYAETIKQYILVDPTYPIHVNGMPYESVYLPVMNYEGHTYIPLKAVGDILGASVAWNEQSRVVEISYGTEENGNTAFRNVEVTGLNGTYTVTGEARVFEATMSYAVSDGHYYLLEGFHTLNEGAPVWSAFTFDINIPQEKLPLNGTLTLELFEYSAKDGSKVNIWPVTLESFGA